MAYHYASDVASLLEQCLVEVLEVIGSSSSVRPGDDEDDQQAGASGDEGHDDDEEEENRRPSSSSLLHATRPAGPSQGTSRGRRRRDNDIIIDGGGDNGGTKKRPSNLSPLYDMIDTLAETERILYEHFYNLYQDEVAVSSASCAVSDTPAATSTTAPAKATKETASPSSPRPPPPHRRKGGGGGRRDLSSLIGLLNAALQQRQQQQEQNLSSSAQTNAGSHWRRRGGGGDTSSLYAMPPNAPASSLNGGLYCYFPKRNETDSLLFRLVVRLQLCLVRIDDARYVVTGRRQQYREDNRCPHHASRKHDVRRRRGDHVRPGLQADECENDDDDTDQERHEKQHRHQGNRPQQQGSQDAGTGSNEGNSRNYEDDGDSSDSIATTFNNGGASPLVPLSIVISGCAILGMLTTASSPQRNIGGGGVVVGGRDGSTIVTARGGYSSLAIVVVRRLRELQSLLQASAKVGFVAVAANYVRKKWNTVWMSSKIFNSIESIREWNAQWMALIRSNHRRHPALAMAAGSGGTAWSQGLLAPIAAASATAWARQISTSNSGAGRRNGTSRQPPSCGEEYSGGDIEVDEAKSKLLLENALRETPKTSFWHSQGELRFLMLKRAMDVFYASVGTAVQVTGGSYYNGQSGSNIKGGLPSFVSSHPSTETASWQVALATAAAASFFSLTTGASTRRRVAEATSCPESARSLIQNAWGMVSLPSVKNLSLHASKMLKGAAVADRVDISCVPCFVLSRRPAPELEAAVKRFQRKLGRQGNMNSSGGSCNKVPSLSTIHEGSEYRFFSSSSSSSLSSLANSNHQQYYVRSSHPASTSDDSAARTGNNASGPTPGRHRPRRDVIFHLTGGGFFAHTIASDLPYLLDWSDSTGAVVICPEYALLPDHAFPDALHQVEDVYRTLRFGDVTTAAQILGFEVNKIIVTGESAGGNLAASLCVKLCMDHVNCSNDSENKNDGSSEDAHSDASAPSPAEDTGECEHEEADAEGNGTETKGDGDGDVSNDTSDREEYTPPSPHHSLPDALMLSCAVLNLSLELSLSRVVGTEDPVLPSGLISAISDAYVPNELGIGKRDPLASPYYAGDDVLRHFPPTLLFASSNDPVLDDSVVWNQRLRSLGVESELRAAQNLPHAYLGLGTAGFPEAQQVQEECQQWLSYQLSREVPATKKPPFVIAS